MTTVAKCNLCPSEKAFAVPYPYDEAGASMMAVHLKEEHNVTTPAWKLV